MVFLLAAALLWLGIHIGIAGTSLRGVIVGRTGEPGFRIFFSLASIASLVLLVAAWRTAPTTLLWVAPDWLRWVLVATMAVAFVLFTASLIRNPTMLGADAGAAQSTRGIQRITRHPMLWAFALWAAIHMIGNGDTAALVFFGTIFVSAVAGMPSIDAKLAARDPATWQTLAGATSIVPFAAILAGRNRLVLSELGWVMPLIGIVAWAGVLHLHPWLFGVAPVQL